MKTLTLIAIGFLFYLNASAEQFQARVLKIEPALNDSDVSLIYLDDGQLVRLNSVDTLSLKRFQLVEISGDTVKFDLVHTGSYDDVGELVVVPESFHPDVNPFTFESKAAQSFQPTDLGSIEIARDQFKKLNRNMRSRSQCYQRAENWSYEMWRSSNIYSMKNFMFFTRKFIRDHNYHWWFHVTPMVMVSGVEYSMDRTFTDEPLTMPVWTSEFMPQGIQCPVVEKYSDYQAHQEEQYCYHIRVPMYYYQPLSVEDLEKGKIVTDWVPSELEHARRAYR